MAVTAMGAQMMRHAVLGILCILPAVAAGQDVPSRGPSDRPGWMSESYLHTTDAVALCLRRDAQWQDFCNGLMQGYADYAVVEGKVCLPLGITRQELVEIFTSPEIVVTTGYIDDWPALTTAVQLFIQHFPCA